MVEVATRLHRQPETRWRAEVPQKKNRDPNENPSDTFELTSRGSRSSQRDDEAPSGITARLRIENRRRLGLVWATRANETARTKSTERKIGRLWIVRTYLLLRWRPVAVATRRLVEERTIDVDSKEFNQPLGRSFGSLSRSVSPFQNPASSLRSRLALLSPRAPHQSPLFRRTPTTILLMSHGYSFAWSYRSGAAHASTAAAAAASHPPSPRRRSGVEGSLHGGNTVQEAEDDTAGSAAALALALATRHRVLGCVLADAALPSGLAAECRTALALHPALVEAESDPLAFALAQGWDHPLAAAVQLALYWKVRSQLLGETRVFRSLSALDGSGALGSDDLGVLASGVLSFLPVAAMDNGDRHRSRSKVLLCDPSRWPSGVPASWMSGLRCALHLATLAAAETLPSSSSPSLSSYSGEPPDIRLVVILRPDDCLPFLSGSTSSSSTVRPPMGSLRLLVEALPVRLSQVVLVPGEGWDSSGGNPQLFAACAASGPARIVSEAFRGSGGGGNGAPTVRIVEGPSPARVASQLREALQLTAASLPSSLGGTWNNNLAGGRHFVPGDRENTVRRGPPTTPFLLPTVGSAGGPAANGDLLASCQARTSALAATAASQLPLPLATLPGFDALDLYRATSVTTAASASTATPRSAAADASVPRPFPDGRLLRELYGAIHLLQPRDKADFLQVQQAVPERVERESPPLRFLRFENYDFWAAARRLAKYWKRRHELFGDRWLLPMNQTGEGALTRDDINVLRSGYYALLPNDADGRPVLCGHPSRRGDHSRLPRLRLAFYMWSIVSESDKAQTEGCVVLAVLQKPTLDRVVRECRELVLEILPLRVHRLHLVYPPLDSLRHSFLQSLAPLCLKLFGRLLEGVAAVHVADTADELVAKLGQHGLSRRGIPQDLGGDWRYELFHQWCELRMCYEWDLPVVGARRHAGDAEELPTVPSYRAPARSELDEDEQVERKRRLNVLHSRRKRERSRVEREVLVGRVTELRTEHARLVRERERLETMVDRAQALVVEGTEHTADGTAEPIGGSAVG